MAAADNNSGPSTFGYIRRDLDDLPKRAVGALVVDAGAVVGALFVEHAEEDQPPQARALLLARASATSSY
jgi:hypothetical protein